MNHIIACTLGVLGAGAFCAHGESPAASADGQTVASEKNKSTVAAAPAVQVPGVKLGSAELEKVKGIEGASCSITTRNGTAPGEMKIGVTPEMEVSSAEYSAIPRQKEILLTRKGAVPVEGQDVSGIRISSVEVDEAGVIKEAVYSVKTTGDPDSGKMEISVAPRQEGASDEVTAIPGKGRIIISQTAMEGGEGAPVMRFIAGDSANSRIAISTMEAEKAEGVKEAAYSITTTEGAAPGSMEITVTPGKEEATTEASAAPDQAAAKKDDRAVVQIALLLDTSGSMTGLINQARTYLWKIVNDMTLARQNGKLPDIRIALYEYGNDGLSSQDDWIRQVLPFTDDLDKVSEELFKLNTSGGTECCGAVIDRAVKELKWNTEDPNALKLVFIAGNEPFNQGSVPYAESIARGLAKGITVNTIHCGSAGDRDTALWKDGAKKGDGSFLNIDHNATPPDPETPYDAELAKLSSSLNGTYLAYGSSEVQAERLSKQESQDKQALELSSSASIGRVMAKANKAAYRNTSWDLVDLYERDGLQALGKVNSAGQLPRELEGKTPEEVAAIVKKKAEERGTLQKKVRELDARRSEWLAKWKAQQSVSNNARPDNLDDAIIRTVRKQASKKQFSFVEENGAEGKNSPVK